MKQHTVIDEETFQAITTLETQCPHCGHKLAAVAHATVTPDHPGVSFIDRPSRNGMSFLDYEAVIQKQAEATARLRADKDAQIVDLREKVDLLKKALAIENG